MDIIHNIYRPLTIEEQDVLRCFELVREKSPAEVYDPSGLVAAAREQWPGFPALAEAFAQCTMGWASHEGIRFCPRERVCQRTPLGHLTLHHSELGELNVTLMTDENAASGFAVERIDPSLFMTDEFTDDDDDLSPQQPFATR